ncbi:MAG: zinc-ribbon domain-containing protein [Syntrophales bacterium LBB04]|nr:zinc-ribbon domain-containing protein [Syntrophales bacterium LBB04]
MTRLTETYNLQALKPLLAREWHPTLNGTLTPDKVTPHSTKEVWWLCSRGHEWKASVTKRYRGYVCPRCGHLRGRTEKSLATQYPDIAKEWHPLRNNNISPADVAPHSGLSYWWICEKGHEWKAAVANRVRGRGCPYCAGRLVAPERSLQAVNPDLAREWDPSANGSLTPSDVTAGSNRKVWWCCAEGHVWVASVTSRHRGAGCPYCARKKR